MKSAVFDLHMVNGPEGSYTFMLTSGPEFRSPLHFHTPTLVVFLLVCSLQSLREIGGSRTCVRLKHHPDGHANSLVTQKDCQAQVQRLPLTTI